MHGSQSIFPGASSSRPFLNMLNPMGRTYQGYMQANQSVVEEEEEEVENGDTRPHLVIRKDPYIDVIFKLETGDEEDEQI